MKRKDLIGSIVFLIVAGGLFIHTGSYPVNEAKIAVLNPGFYPRLLSIILGVLSVILFIGSIGKTDEEGAKILQTPKAVFLFLSTVLMLVLFPLVLKLLGFAAASFIFLFVLIFILTENSLKRIVPIIIISAGLSGIMFTVFKLILKIPFPSGILI